MSFEVIPVQHIPQLHTISTVCTATPTTTSLEQVRPRALLPSKPNLAICGTCCFDVLANTEDLL